MPIVLLCDYGLDLRDRALRTHSRSLTSEGVDIIYLFPTRTRVVGYGGQQAWSVASVELPCRFLRDTNNPIPTPFCQAYIWSQFPTDLVLNLRLSRCSSVGRVVNRTLVNNTWTLQGESDVRFYCDGVTSCSNFQFVLFRAYRLFLF